MMHVAATSIIQLLRSICQQHRMNETLVPFPLGAMTSSGCSLGFSMSVSQLTGWGLPGTHGKLGPIEAAPGPLHSILLEK
jgi:hypothetical protein